MKKLLLITVLAILVVAATAQETRKTFCEIFGTGKVLSSKVKIQIGKKHLISENTKRLW